MSLISSRDIVDLLSGSGSGGITSCGRSRRTGAHAARGYHLRTSDPNAADIIHTHHGGTKHHQVARCAHAWGRRPGLSFLSASSPCTGRMCCRTGFGRVPESRAVASRLVAGRQTGGRHSCESRNPGVQSRVVCHFESRSAVIDGDTLTRSPRGDSTPSSPERGSAPGGLGHPGGSPPLLLQQAAPFLTTTAKGCLGCPSRGL